MIPRIDAAARPRLELWGGVESTVNRVADTYFDQGEWSGHAHRIDDLDRIAAIGIRTVRYPVLWEKVAPGDLRHADWSWTDARLGRLRHLGITPIAGLVHHGSGPRHTNLLDPAFAPGLADYARAVAERYPWLRDFTPVNEPLTTARFAALYGHWYPHAKDGLSWARALLNQCRATVLAMRAIREVIPEARLVQTEDMGKTHSTPPLAYQAEFENERRWLTFDLLCGRVTPGHRMHQFLTWLGVEEQELAWFAENPCPPDVLGINHYLTSERFLDDQRRLYPLHAQGGNGRDVYADVEAVRVRAQGLEGPGALLLECWERYRLPIAVTEAHLSSTREEQLRWLLEVWRGAEAARSRGADVRAVTAWSLFGAYNWNTLVTRDEGYYEPGAFDLRAPQPRPTALTWIIQELAAGRTPRHPVLDEPGWWRRPRTRLEYPPVRSAQPRAALALSQRRFSMRSRRAGRTRPLLITGGTGRLGQAFAHYADLRAIAYAALGRSDLDAADEVAVGATLDALKPWAVVNAAGSMQMDAAEHDPARCFRENAETVRVLARACAQRGIPLVTFSSDLVFDGSKRELYVESDPTAPLSVYGRSKAAAERAALEEHPQSLVIRTCGLFGPRYEPSFLTSALTRLAAGKPFAAPEEVVSPAYRPHLVNAALDLLLDAETGIWHVTNAGALTWLQFVQQAAEMAGIDTSCLEPAPPAPSGAAPRPPYSVLGSERGSLLPSIDVALQCYLRERLAAGLEWGVAPSSTLTGRAAGEADAA